MRNGIVLIIVIIVIVVGGIMMYKKIGFVKGGSDGAAKVDLSGGGGSHES